MPKNFLDRHKDRGFRNNNPGNLRLSKDNWVGKLNDGKDAEFVRFVNMRYGLRALFINIRTQFTKYNLNTISKIIRKYAPENENNTVAYINAVVKDLNVSANTPLAYSKDIAIALAKSIVEMENGDDDSRLLDNSDYTDAFDAIGHTSVKNAVEWLYYLPLAIPFIAYLMFNPNN